MMTISVIDKFPIMRMGLELILKENFKNFNLIGASDYAEFQRIENSGDIKLFILGINDYPSLETMVMINEVKTIFPDAPIMVYGENVESQQVISYLKSGAMGYLSKQSDLSEFIICVKMLLAGKKYIDVANFDIIFNGLLEEKKGKPKRTFLSSRQFEIAQYLSQGMKISAIAKQLGLHLSTVSTVKSKIFTKLGVDNVVKLRELIG